MKSATTQLATGVADFYPQDGLCPSEGITKALLPLAKAAQRAVTFLGIQMCQNEGKAIFEAQIVTSLVGTLVPLLQEMYAMMAVLEVRNEVRQYNFRFGWNSMGRC